MPNIHTELVKKRHPYTGEDVPWDVEAVPGSTLWRCLRGGPPAAGTSAQAAVVRRQERFLRFSLVVVAVWLLYFFL
jgi:hypothetical protein